jgi:hypothetical protein
MADKVSLSPNWISYKFCRETGKKDGQDGTHADGYGVILIDDGNNIHCQQFFESVDCIKKTRTLGTMLYKWNRNRWRKKGTIIHPKYLLSSKALVQWVARADQIDYPKAL